MAKGRGRLPAIRMLPPECSHIVMWAAAELQESSRTQVDIYQEFVAKLEEVQRVSRGEIDFKIPSLSMFNRYSIYLDAMTRDLNETREMTAAIAETLDAKESDDMTLVATEALKAATFTLLRRHRDKIGPKDIKLLSDALRSINAAQSMSTNRRQKLDAEEKSKVEKVIDVVAKEKGMSADTINQLKRDFLGVRDKPKKEE